MTEPSASPDIATPISLPGAMATDPSDCSVSVMSEMVTPGTPSGAIDTPFSVSTPPALFSVAAETVSPTSAPASFHDCHTWSAVSAACAVPVIKNARAGAAK